MLIMLVSHLDFALIYILFTTNIPVLNRLVQNGPLIFKA